MAEDKLFLEEHYWDDPTGEEWTARDARICARRAELGYQDFD